MADETVDIPYTTEDDRFQVRIKKNHIGQVGYLIVDTQQDDEPFAAVLPETKNKPRYQLSRERKAYKLCDELNHYDKSDQL